MTDSTDRLQITVADRSVGTLGRGQAGMDSVFSYREDITDQNAVSLTMPTRLESYGWERGIHPVFEMNLPEGALRDELVRRFSKAVRGFDDFSLLAIVGPHQLGRLAISSKSTVDRQPETALADLLVHDGAQGLFEDLLQTYGQYSGVSGVQPKVLVRDSAAAVDRLTHRGSTHLVKAFRPEEFPELATNEYFCMRAAALSGLEVPKFELSERGKFLVVERFDLSDRGYLGFEDFCVLNGWASKAKYDGSYEGASRQIKAYVSPALLSQAMEDFFKIVALSAGLKNGDAHLKNFGVLYDNCGAQASIRLAPAYDIITTSVYIKNDSLALLLGGSKAWPKNKVLMRFGRTACNLTEGRCNELLQQVVQGMQLAMDEMADHMRTHQPFAEVGAAMIEQWKSGMERSLIKG
ncbi:MULTISPECIES: type II toxin-antitoxin system HipA family toxin [unclassified Pseudomonas]|uniref:type II toxin-antitoxin system HipA family toxin n=1 Tax=unclassified Pseudomonas TaxID=196821 RepID=UPI001B32E93F|nr:MULTISPECIES: type II toxin-antitoxin system HipA family toxin [unclassified Pseudomonas]MBP5946253.1 type II toxin-antitoxin system HipA family toxin [Pseudomonas sp. P9(2020)]MBZ9564392.1 type II toxin-antitoxin system HipA family toxin [Pseudomonas sp. P116]